MAVYVVENGTGLSDANTYTAVAYFNDFLDLSGKTCCTTDITREAQLYNATRYIETVYQGRIIGEPLQSTQALIFPRLLDDGTTLYPDALQKAICELAIKSEDNDSVLLKDTDKRVISERLDVIERKFDTYSTDETQYVSVYNLLQPYLIDDTSSYSHSVTRS